MSDLEPQIGINVRLRGSLVVDFFQVKTHLGLESNPDVIRHLIHKQARALRRRSRSRPRAAPSSAQGPASAHSTPKSEAAEEVCLSCALPECDESDPRCAYQQATGQRAAKRARTRKSARRRRAASRE